MEWAARYDWEPVSPLVIPYGKVTFHRDTPCAAGFILMDRTAHLALIPILLTDPDASKICTAIGLKKTISELLSYAEEEFDGKGLVVEITRNRSIQRFVEKMGFKRGERDLTTLVYSIGGVSADFLMEDNNAPR